MIIKKTLLVLTLLSATLTSAIAVDNNYGYGGQLYEDGEYNKAMRYLPQNCSNGQSRACADLGNAYDHGNGVKKDAAKAIEFQQKACAISMSDDIEAYNALTTCTILAEKEIDGRGIPKNEISGFEKLQKYCSVATTDNGGFWACKDIVFIYKNGVDKIKKDSKKAKEALSVLNDLEINIGLPSTTKLPEIKKWKN